MLFSLKKSKLFVVLFCLLCFFQAGLSWKMPWSSKDLSYDLERINDRFVFKASIFIRSEPECLLETIFRFYHLQQLLKGEADKVELLRDGKEHYDVRFVHRGQLYVIDTTYRRTLQKDQNRVTFELLESKQEGRMIPKILSSQGHYTVEPATDGARLHYYEETRISTGRWDPRTAGLVEIVERDTLSFLKNLKKYSENISCRKN